MISLLQGNSIGACQRFHSTVFGVIASSDGRGWLTIPSQMRHGAGLLFAPNREEESRIADTSHMRSIRASIHSHLHLQEFMALPRGNAPASWRSSSM